MCQLLTTHEAAEHVAMQRTVYDVETATGLGREVGAAVKQAAQGTSGGDAERDATPDHSTVTFPIKSADGVVATKLQFDLPVSAELVMALKSDHHGTLGQAVNKLVASKRMRLAPSVGAFLAHDKAFPSLNALTELAKLCLARVSPSSVSSNSKPKNASYSKTATALGINRNTVLQAAWECLLDSASPTGDAVRMAACVLLKAFGLATSHPALRVDPSTLADKGRVDDARAIATISGSAQLHDRLPYSKERFEKWHTRLKEVVRHAHMRHLPPSEKGVAYQHTLAHLRPKDDRLASELSGLEATTDANALRAVRSVAAAEAIATIRKSVHHTRRDWLQVGVSMLLEQMLTMASASALLGGAQALSRAATLAGQRRALRAWYAEARVDAVEQPSTLELPVSVPFELSALEDVLHEVAVGRPPPEDKWARHALLTLGKASHEPEAKSSWLVAAVPREDVDAFAKLSNAEAVNAARARQLHLEAVSEEDAVRFGVLVKMAQDASHPLPLAYTPLRHSEFRLKFLGEVDANELAAHCSAPLEDVKSRLLASARDRARHDKTRDKVLQLCRAESGLVDVYKSMPHTTDLTVQTAVNDAAMLINSGGVLAVCTAARLMPCSTCVSSATLAVRCRTPATVHTATRCWLLAMTGTASRRSLAWRTTNSDTRGRGRRPVRSRPKRARRAERDLQGTQEMLSKVIENELRGLRSSANVDATTEPAASQRISTPLSSTLPDDVLAPLQPANGVQPGAASTTIPLGFESTRAHKDDTGLLVDLHAVSSLQELSALVGPVRGNAVALNKLRRAVSTNLTTHNTLEQLASSTAAENGGYGFDLSINLDRSVNAREKLRHLDQLRKAWWAGDNSGYVALEAAQLEAVLKLHWAMVAWGLDVFGFNDGNNTCKVGDVWKYAHTFSRGEVTFFTNTVREYNMVCNEVDQRVLFVAHANGPEGQQLKDTLQQHWNVLVETFDLNGMGYVLRARGFTVVEVNTPVDAL